MTATAKAAVVGELAECAEALEPEQLALLPTSAEPGSDRHRGIVEAARRGVGRPKGAKNKTTREMLDFVRINFGDPIERRARWLLHTPESLARELGCTRLEAFDRLNAIAADLAPYFYARLAPVDGAGNAVAPFFALQIGAKIQGGDGRAPWEYLDGQAVEITQQSQTEKAGSHGAGSHETAK